VKLKKSIQKWLLIGSGFLLLLIAFGAWPEEPNDPTLPETVDFNFHIRPLLSQNCFVCHGPDSSTRKAGVRLDSFEFATAQLEHGGAAIVPGKPGKSLLIKRITSDEPDFRMPPPEAKKILSKREIALLERWIDEGAKWKPYWAFIPPEKPTLPQSFVDSSPSDIIDHLVDKKLSENQLRPSQKAAKNALIRRASYLLTGLPPGKEDMQCFISDASENSYKEVIDHYLSSPRFGERWARHWMDLVRYAETMGHEGDFNISHPWEYRDYLIRAFNTDVPYDLFVKEHLAGDMLENPRRNPEKGFNESVIGTGYVFLGEGKHGPVDIKLEEADKIDNVIDVTSKTFLGLTVGCARCHDHKFDPIPTTDYYAMYGMFESSRLGPIPARKTLEQEDHLERLMEIKGEIRNHVGRQLTLYLEETSSESIRKQKQFIQTLAVDSKPEGSYKVLGDFRDGNWEGWSSDGWGFGESPLRGEPIIDRKSNAIRGLRSGIASSKVIANGIQGVLRSPNFIIEHDSLAVRATGNTGLIRIIIDNFQVIQGPLWQGLEAIIEDPEWRTYKFDLSLAKGHKAYLQFTPGHYGRRREHTYRIQPDDYIEVEYAVAYDHDLPDLQGPIIVDLTDYSLESQKQAIEDWTQNLASPQQIHLVDNLLKSTQTRLSSNAMAQLAKYDNITPHLYDSTHFIGLTGGEPLFSPVFIRGSVHNLSEEKVPRGFLSAIKAGPESFPQEGSGRLAWAESLVDPLNPLTSRIIVNRIWHHIFGRGIVETVDNFGVQGKLPTHPELLDYLAIRMIEDGWSIKKMIRHILLSQTFQRSTEIMEANQTIDPDNYFIHHFPIRRLEAEAIRDGILAVSGCLDTTMYGKPVPVHLTKFLVGRGKPKGSGPLDGHGRRSIYQSVRRNFLSPMMLVFDMPTPFNTFGRRNTTNVPAQSLTLMNDPFVKDQAVKWAGNLLTLKGYSLAERINEIYLSAFSRPAQPNEIQRAQALLETQAQTYGSSLDKMKDDPRLWSGYCHAVFNLKEFVHLL